MFEESVHMGRHRPAGPPLSPGQRALWLTERIHPGTPVHHVPLAVQLDGPLDVAALERAIGRVLARHEALRTAFPPGHDEPYQQITPEVVPHLPLTDLVTVDGNRQRQAEELLQRWADTPFDIARGPLLRTKLIRLDAERHVFGIFMHHLICDGRSLRLLFEELAAAYAGEPAPPPLTTHFSDHATQRRMNAVDDEDLAWWLEHLADAPTLLPLPLDRPRPARRQLDGASVRSTLPGPLMAAVSSLARELRVTPFALLTAAYAALLGRLTGTDDMLIGTPVDDRRSAELDPLIGYFVDVLPIRVGLAGDPGFGQLARHVHDRVLDLLSHPGVPFESLVRKLAPRRDPAYSPLVQTMFMVEPVAPIGPRFGDLQVTRLDLTPSATDADLYVTLARTGGDDFRMTMTYNTGLFEAGTISALCDEFQRMLASGVADPGAPLSSIPIGRVAAPAVYLTSHATPEPRTLLDILDDTATSYPHAIALDDGQVRFDYSSLLREVAVLAERLASAGVGHGDRVGIQVPSGTVELYLSILAVLSIGAAYVPVDEDDPRERVELVFAEAGVRAVIGANRRITPVDRPAVDVGRLIRPGLDDDAWIMFTSGTTGVPKGVAVTHRNAAAFVDAEADLFLPAHPIRPGDRVMTALSVAFDGSCQEMWLAWRHGACLVPAPRAIVRAGADLGPWIARHGVTVVSTVPTLAALWPTECFDAVRLLILAGEQSPPELIERYASPSRELWNCYGPTEATVTASVAPLVPGQPIRIGLPLRGWDLAVVDADGDPVAMGATGELVIGGAGLARYLDAAKDAEKFAPLPALGWDRAYRSGDLVQADPAGLTYLGRADDQVKVGGRRIELGEIEAALHALPGVRAAAAAVRAIPGGQQVLVGYVVPTDSADGFDELSARQRLRVVLPAALVPRIAVVDALPTRTSGKVDRAALPWPLPAAHEEEPTPNTGLEESLARVWRRVLALDDVGPHDNFFDLGGTSLTLAAVHDQLRHQFDVRLPMLDLFEFPTIAALAERLRAGAEPVAGPIDEHAARLVAGRARLSARRRTDDRRATS